MCVGGGRDIVFDNFFSGWPEAEVVVLGEVRGRAAPLKFGRMDQTVRMCRVFYDK